MSIPADRDKRERIACANSVQHRRHQPREPERGDDSDPHAKQREPRTFTEDHAQDIAALRSECHSNSDFMRAAGGAERNHSVNSHAREQQREAAEHA